jgi:hypothetical protein
MRNCAKDEGRPGLGDIIGLVRGVNKIVSVIALYGIPELLLLRDAVACPSEVRRSAALAAINLKKQTFHDQFRGLRA